MQEVAESVYCLGPRSHNFYVIVDGSEATMIDAGCSGEWRVLVDGLERLGLALEAVSGLVITHVHADHFGTAREAADGGVDVAVHREEEPRALGTYTGRFAASATDLPMYRLHVLRTFLPMIRRGVLHLDHLERVGTFADGDVLDLPGRPVAVHTPGHTEGHTMFHMPERGLLFTGDGLITMDLLAPREGPQVIDGRFDVDHEQAIGSLDRIVDLDAELILPGHGMPWPGSPRGAVAVASAAL